MKNLDLNLNLLMLHDKINIDKCEILNLLYELEYPNINRQVTEYTRLLCVNHISLCELSYFIKEYLLFKKILLT